MTNLSVFLICLTFPGVFTSCQSGPGGGKTIDFPGQAKKTLPAWTKSGRDLPGSSRQVRVLTKLIEVTAPEASANFPTERYQRKMDDAERQMFLRKMAQKKGVDLMTSPSLTLKNGQSGKVALVREFRYPEAAGAEDQKTEEIGVSQYFRVRSLGQARRYRVDVLIDVTEFAGFAESGEDHQKPVFARRRIEELVTLNNGETAMFGGLVSGQKQEVEDKVPFLGDLPLIGRLFTKSLTVELKRELIALVSVEEIDPAGRPLGAKKR